MSGDFTTLGQQLIQRGLSIAVAESCTGGNLSAGLTSIAGASSYFDRGFITYSNAAKMQLLGVSEQTLETQGAVSEAVALEMAQGAIKHSDAQVSVAISGIAGPGGGSAEKPVGMVCFGFCIQDHCFTQTQYFQGERSQIVAQSLDYVVQILTDELST